MNSLKLTVLAVMYAVVLCHVSGHHYSPSLSQRKFVKPGNITISGLFPVHVGGCRLEHFRCKYVGLSQAMIYAIERVNNDSLLLENITLGYEIYDDCLLDHLSMEVAMEIINRKKLSSLYAKEDVCLSESHGLGQSPVVIGSGTSGGSVVVSNLLQVESIALISYAATSDTLSRKATYPTFLRTVPPDRYQSQAMADLAERFNWTYIAAVAIDNAYGRSGIDYLKKSLSTKRLCLAMEGYYTVDQNNMNLTKYKITRIVKELKSFRYLQVIVLYGTTPVVLPVLEEAERQGLYGKTWIASEGWAEDPRIIKYSNIVKGLLGVVYRYVAVEDFLQYLMSLTPQYKPVEWWEDFWKTCTNYQPITRQYYQDIMRTRMSAAVINAVYAIAHALDSMYKCNEPHGLLEGGKCPSVTRHVKPADLLVYLKAVNFTSPVSRVCFDSNGDTSGSYSIINLQKQKDSWVFHPVGSWDALRSPQLQINDVDVMWGGDIKGKLRKSICQEACPPGQWQTEKVGCCWQCIDCSTDEISGKYSSRQCTKCPEDYIPNNSHTKCLKVPLFHISYSHPFGYSFISISCVGLLTTLCVCAIFVRFNKSPVVKAANRELSYMLLFCICMCYFAPFIYLAEPSNIGCILVQVWFYIFYTTCIAILAAKTNKIVVLFQERVPRHQYASGLPKYRHVLFVIFAILVELVIIVIWVAVDPPRPYINKTNREEYIHTCKPSARVAGKVCSYFLMSILIMASLLCCYAAYKARKLPDNFNEGKFIVFSLYILIISWLTFYPVFLNIQDIYTAVVLCATTVVSASGILLCMFWPKVYIILFRPEKNTKQYIQEQLSRHAFRLSTVETAKALSRPRSAENRHPGPIHVNTRL